MTLTSTHHTVFKNNFILLVATGTTPFFAVVSIIFPQDCNLNINLLTLTDKDVVQTKS